MYGHGPNLLFGRKPVLISQSGPVCDAVSLAAKRKKKQMIHDVDAMRTPKLHLVCLTTARVSTRGKKKRPQTNSHLYLNLPLQRVIDRNNEEEWHSWRILLVMRRGRFVSWFKHEPLLFAPVTLRISCLAEPRSNQDSFRLAFVLHSRIYLEFQRQHCPVVKR